MPRAGLDHERIAGTKRMMHYGEVIPPETVASPAVSKRKSRTRTTPPGTKNPGVSFQGLQSEPTAGPSSAFTASQAATNYGPPVYQR